MPLYDYRCAGCGDFREIARMAESGASRACPTCGAPSERVLVAPFLGKDPCGLTPRPAGQPSVRGACGHGCSHAHHG